MHLTNIDQVTRSARFETPAKSRRRNPVSEPLPSQEPRTTIAESILDNLGAWTVIAAAIGLLYLVWATLEILSRYVGGVPKVLP